MTLSKDTNSNFKPWLWILGPASLIVFVGIYVSTFLDLEKRSSDKTIKPINESRVADLTLRSSTNESPHLGIFQLREHITDSYIKDFVSNYKDSSGQLLDVTYENIDGGDYGINTKHFHTKRFPISETETMSLSVITGGDGSILRVTNDFTYRNRISCEAAYQYIESEMKEFYNVVEEPFKKNSKMDYLTAYKVNVAYPVGEEFYMSVSSDCNHEYIKDVVVRVGVLKEFYLERLPAIDIELYKSTLFTP